MHFTHSSCVLYMSGLKQEIDTFPLFRGDERGLDQSFVRSVIDSIVYNYVEFIAW